jgi:hypothetical protein
MMTSCDPICWDHPLTLGQVSGSTKGRAGHKKNIEWRLRGNHKRTGLEPLGVYCPSYIPTGLWPCWSTGNISLVDKEPFTLWCASLSHHYFVTSILGSHRYLLRKSCLVKMLSLMKGSFWQDRFSIEQKLREIKNVQATILGHIPN